MEIEETVLDFNRICRLCLTEETVMSSLYNEGDTDSDSVPLPIRIMACASVEISSNDGLPSQICASCLCQVDGWYRFKDLCESADSILRKCIKNEPVQVEAISEVKTMAQEVKKYFSSDLKGDANDQNKNLSPKKKMGSTITGPPVMTCPPLSGPNFVVRPSSVMSNSDVNQNVNLYARGLPPVIRAVPPSAGGISSNLLPGGAMPCFVRAFPASALGRVPSNGEIVVNSVINNPVIRPQLGKEQLVMNFGQLQLYQLNPTQPVFRAPFPVPAKETFANERDRKAVPRKKVKPKLCKWTNVNFDDVCNSLSGNGSGPEMESEPENDVDEPSDVNDDDVPSPVYDPDPKRFKFKNPIVEDCVKNYGENEKSDADTTTRKKKGKKEPEKPTSTQKTFKKEEFGIGEGIQELRVEKSLYTFRLDADGNIDLVDVIEGDFKDYSLENKGGHNCVICNEHCLNRDKYDLHLKTEHLEKMMCRVCDKQLFALRSYLVHLGVHLGLETFPCPICGKKFARARTLKDHMRRHKKENVSKCEICGKDFTTIYYLKKHVLSHNMEKNKCFDCEFCDFKTHCKYNLDYHISSHLNKKEFMCEYCGKRFNNSSSLEYHRLTHEKPKYPCQFCKRKYRWLPKYQIHLQRDHGDKLAAENIVIEEMVQDGMENIEYVDSDDEFSAEEDGQTTLLKDVETGVLNEVHLEETFNNDNFFSGDVVVESLDDSMNF